MCECKQCLFKLAHRCSRILSIIQFNEFFVRRFFGCSFFVHLYSRFFLKCCWSCFVLLSRSPPPSAVLLLSSFFFSFFIFLFFRFMLSVHTLMCICSIWKWFYINICVCVCVIVHCAWCTVLISYISLLFYRFVSVKTRPESETD